MPRREWLASADFSRGDSRVCGSEVGNVARSETVRTDVPLRVGWVGARIPMRNRCGGHGPRSASNRSTCESSATAVPRFDANGGGAFQNQARFKDVFDLSLAMMAELVPGKKPFECRFLKKERFASGLETTRRCRCRGVCERRADPSLQGGVCGRRRSLFRAKRLALLSVIICRAAARERALGENNDLQLGRITNAFVQSSDGRVL